jgi:hypothetical protein
VVVGCNPAAFEQLNHIVSMMSWGIVLQQHLELKASSLRELITKSPNRCLDLLYKLKPKK